jgi:hypothetical protein
MFTRKKHEEKHFSNFWERKEPQHPKINAKSVVFCKTKNSFALKTILIYLRPVVNKKMSCRLITV